MGFISKIISYRRHRILMVHLLGDTRIQKHKKIESTANQDVHGLTQKSSSILLNIPLKL